MDVFLTQIEWLSPEQGGRKKVPLENMYCPIIIPEGNVFDLGKECWSIIVSNIQIIGALKTVSKIQYFSEKAPEKFFPGMKFMLYEGSKLVAKGIVLEKSGENKNL